MIAWILDRIIDVLYELNPRMADHNETVVLWQLLTKEVSEP